jgi:hypothetical protein
MVGAIEDTSRVHEAPRSGLLPCSGNADAAGSWKVEQLHAEVGARKIVLQNSPDVASWDIRSQQNRYRAGFVEFDLICLKNC